MEISTNVGMIWGGSKMMNCCSLAVQSTHRNKQLEIQMNAYQFCLYNIELVNHS